MSKERLILAFRHPVSLKGVDREELIEGLSFPVYRRVATLMLFLPVDARRSTTEMVPVDPVAPWRKPTLATALPVPTLDHGIATRIARRSSCAAFTSAGEVNTELQVTGEAYGAIAC